MTDSRAWIQQQLDTRQAAFEVPLDEADEADETDDDPDGYVAWQGDEEGDEAETDEDEDEQDDLPYRPPTSQDLIEHVLTADRTAFEAETGATPEAYLEWAATCAPSEWDAAAAAAGMPGAQQPSSYDLPIAMRTALLQAEIDEKVRQAREGRR